jgi:integrase
MLTPDEIKNKQTGRHADSDGLYLQVSASGAKSWLYRYQIEGRRREYGIGSLSKFTLAQARKERDQLRLKVKAGIDPLAEKQKNKAIAERDKKEAANKAMTFEVCAEKFIDIMEAQWSNSKHRDQWRNTLRDYAYPIIGNLPICDIETTHVRECLDPIWFTKTETAKRLRQRIESVIDYAIASGYRQERNPAIWKGLLDKAYPKPSKVMEVKHEKAGTEKHHPALPYGEMPAFMKELIKQQGVAAKALRFTILTASRTGEVRFATWDEFDLEKKEWNIPKLRMKARKPHRVALSDAAVELLKNLPKDTPYVFPGGKIGKPLSENGMAAVLKRMGRKDITVHGFRSTFRDYIGEETGFPHRLAEFALAHGLTDEAEKAYARGDLLKKRFKMMNAWAAYVDSAKGNVTHIKRKQRA